MQRFKDINWAVNGKQNSDGSITVNTVDDVKKALLLDLRDELNGIRVAVESMNRTLLCRNFQTIPKTLRDIRDIRDRRCHKKHMEKKR